MEQLQEQITQLRGSDIMAMYNNFKSAIYQPDKVAINSKDDSSEIVYSDKDIGFYNSFRINFKTPLLNVRSVELLKATIPIITTNIPDTETTFWYYRLPVNNPYLEPVPPDITYLHCVRLQPSYTPTELINSYLIPPLYPINKYYNTYQDLAYDLSNACVKDSNNPYFISGDISINFDASSNKFSFTGNNIYDGDGNLQYFYIYAGYNDPNIAIAAEFLKQSTTNNFGIQGLQGQPYTIGRTLDLRLGFVWSGTTLDMIPYKNRLRPVPDYTPIVEGEVLVHVPTLSFTIPTYTAESYCNLVYSQNCNTYCSIASSSSYSSENGGTPNLLMSIPLNTSALGVSYYNNTQKYPLQHVPKEIYSIEISMKTDQNEPFNFPDSENVMLEIGFEYF